MLFILSFGVVAHEMQVTFLDDNQDKVYFDGDILSVSVTSKEFSSLPKDNPLSLEPVLFLSDCGKEYVSSHFLDDIFIERRDKHCFDISGTLVYPDTMGVMGLRIRVGSEYVVGPFPLIDSSLMEAGSDYGMAITGVAVPGDSLCMYPPLSTFDNLYAIEDTLCFIRRDVGRICIPPGCNVIDHLGALRTISSALSIVTDEKEGLFYAEIDSVSAKLLSQRNAQITLHGIPLTEPVVRSVPFGENAHDTSSLSEKILQAVFLEDTTVHFSVNNVRRYSLMEAYEVVSDRSGTVSAHPDIALQYRPSVQKVYFRLPFSGTPTLRLYTLQGEQVHTQQVASKMRRGHNSISLSEVALQQRMYLAAVEIDDGQGRFFSGARVILVQP
ncbi:hypothetical protein [Chitinivibrio alkaliphilus]|uniref:Uncharacterized protein n=1 Tax=Chitinivibrio alkaliphilus ACht1 TaxID=1313304 RepID=U7D4I7_9BACT|nr:hypothetical protein [Chitinivibrio alkaliphilus]ERP30843.1 hypothetical protein CALK_2294 [Chitinivibrio alkaliphilus ACht1]